MGGWQGEDRQRPEEVRPAQEQEWQNCEQEGHRGGKEGLCQHQGLDSSSGGGKEGPRPEGLCGREEGLTAVRQGKGSLQEVMRRLLLQNAGRTRFQRCGEHTVLSSPV